MGKETIVPAGHAPTETNGTETWCLREANRRSLNVFEIKGMRPTVGITGRNMVHKVIPIK